MCIYAWIDVLIVMCCYVTIGSGFDPDSLDFCSFFNNRAPSPQPSLRNCTWFKKNSCCKQEEIEATFGTVKPLPGSSPGCQRYTNFLMCYICAPNQNLFYGQEKLTVCEEFCNAWYSACSSAILKGSVIGDLYTNGREFCEKRNFMCEPMANKNCFIQLSDYALNHGSGASRVSSLPAVLGSMIFIYKVVMKTF
ncbi:riboflavin-binding protein-like [Ruditapes philippinarum]|uniref:riboflavin-binding protein-like n=1 Tax=Ruditapes philippinarum TaxID=129788 RepID=UPI00295C3053|nr:riboflavin-binding protein-like [Ruditapes philippinarum]